MKDHFGNNPFDSLSNSYEDWRQYPFWLVSLMGILQFHASSFIKIHGLFGQLFTHIDRVGDLSIQDWGSLAQAIEELRGECETLQLRFSLQLIDHFSEEFNSIHDPRKVSQIVKELHRRVVDKLEGYLFLHVPLKWTGYYEQRTPLFGERVEAKFSELTEDISEAGKCLALNRYTATVFHLMRVMEAGLQELGNRLGVNLVEQKNWQPVLDEVNAAIRRMDPRTDPLAKSYAEAAAHLYNVKVAWRNEVMHPKETYTEEEAESIFRNVKAFISDLAQLI